MMHTMRQESIFGHFLQVVVPEHYVFALFVLFLLLFILFFLSLLFASPVVFILFGNIFYGLNLDCIYRSKVITFDSEMTTLLLVNDWWQFGLFESLGE